MPRASAAAILVWVSIMAAQCSGCGPHVESGTGQEAAETGRAAMPGTARSETGGRRSAATCGTDLLRKGNGDPGGVEAQLDRLLEREIDIPIGGIGHEAAR